MKIVSEVEKIKNGKANIAVHITHTGCEVRNAVHFEAILRAMHDTDERAFDLVMMRCIPEFIRGCDDCKD